MSKKQQPSQYNKFYHNDIKKQLGIDQSRTASQKLLDKVIKVQKRADFYSSQNYQGQQIKSQPKKKVKQNEDNQKPLNNKEILQNRLFKNIQNQLNIAKLLKSLTILKKCLNQQNFINDSQINFKQNWQNYTDRLIKQITQRNYCSGQSFNIMGIIGDCIQILYNKFHNKDKQEDGEITQNKSNQSTIKLTKQQVYLSFCRLFTDDSFIFNKYLAKLKTFIFQQFQNQAQQASKQLCFILINKIVLMPIKFQWAYSSLVNLFKEFNNMGYHNQMTNETQRKNYLKNYNQLLNRKPKNSGSTTSYNIMGSAKDAAGLKTVYVESSLQSGSEKWVSKQ